MSKIIEPPLHKEEIIQKKRGQLKSAILGVGLLVLFLAVVLGSLWAISYFKWPNLIYSWFFTEKAPKIWAVYLTIGSQTTTYYGEIVKWKDDYIVLKNPAYIDVRQSQEGQTGEPIVTFRRLAEEFYKPKPEAKIFKKNIIFLQELTADSPIHGAYKQTPQ